MSSSSSGSYSKLEDAEASVEDNAESDNVDNEFGNDSDDEADLDLAGEADLDDESDDDDGISLLPQFNGGSGNRNLNRGEIAAKLALAVVGKVLQLAQVATPPNPLSAVTGAADTAKSLRSLASTYQKIAQLKHGLTIARMAGASSETIANYQYAINQMNAKMLRKGAACMPLVGRAVPLYTVGHAAIKAVQGNRGVAREDYAKRIHDAAQQGDTHNTRLVESLMKGKPAARTDAVIKGYNGWKEVKRKLGK
jgi:hypothetical protein